MQTDRYSHLYGTRGLNLPTPDVLERLAKALGIASHELFLVSTTPEEALERLHYEVLTDIKNVVSEAVKSAVTEQCKVTETVQ